ncbi:MAG: hypothetical protein BWY49_00178 [Candidatus Omnitrophica bacterium ADurb.Bin314]|nr:MAG: hypothetical protein BWY49_00178 [Candidatus Omnitrophica bacterium ADurb.Bin314]
MKAIGRKTAMTASEITNTENPISLAPTIAASTRAFPIS